MQDTSKTASVAQAHQTISLYSSELANEGITQCTTARVRHS